MVVVGGDDDDADENFSVVNDAHRQIARPNSTIAMVMSSPWTICLIPSLLASTLQNKTSLRMKRVQPTDHPCFVRLSKMRSQCATNDSSAGACSGVPFEIAIFVEASSRSSRLSLKSRRSSAMQGMFASARMERR